MDHRFIEHYELLEELGEGGMGVVYKARDTRLAYTNTGSMTSALDSEGVDGNLGDDFKKTAGERGWQWFS